MKIEHFSREQRDQIRDGTLKISPDEITEIVRRPILAELDRIVTMLVKAAAAGRGKFANSGKPTGEFDDDGNPEYEPEHVPIQQRLKLGLDLIKFVTGKEIPDSDANLDQDEFLEKLKADGKIQSGTAVQHDGGTGQEAP